MTKSIPGYWLALIGGILGIIGGIGLLFGGGILATFYSAMGIPFFSKAIAAIASVVLGIIHIVFSALVLMGGIWMKKPETCKKGGLFALIFGVLGGFNILAVIGGILGLVAAGK